LVLEKKSRFCSSKWGEGEKGKGGLKRRREARDFWPKIKREKDAL